MKIASRVLTYLLDTLLALGAASTARPVPTLPLFFLTVLALSMATFAGRKVTLTRIRP